MRRESYGRPFARAIALASMAALIVAAHGDTLRARELLADLPLYTSRGKGGKHPPKRKANRAVKRAAVKRRHVAHNRRMHRA